MKNWKTKTVIIISTLYAVYAGFNHGDIATTFGFVFGGVAAFFMMPMDSNVSSEAKKKDNVTQELESLEQIGVIAPLWDEKDIVKPITK